MANSSADIFVHSFGAVPLSSEQTHFLDRASGKCILTIYLFGAVLAWCCLRSYYGDEGRVELGDTVVPFWIRLLIMTALTVPAAITLRRDWQVAWLVGLSGAVGAVPLLPLLPFLHEYTHVVIMLWLASVSPILLRRGCLNQVPLFVLCILFYLVACAYSAVINFAFFKSIWQIRVGIAFLILFGAFAALVVAIAATPTQAARRFDSLLDGFIWGVFGQAAIALVAIPLIFYLPFSEGNDTVFGLGYYDRYKSTFSGPVSLGMFFVISMPLLLLRAQRTDFVSWAATVYLQFMPWFMMATGSRTARIAAVGTFGLLLSTRTTRRSTLFMLPSAIVAYLVGFDYQSLPAAVANALGRKGFEGLNLSDRFFVVTDRLEFMRETIADMMNAPLFTRLFGFGPGTGGYRLSGLPTPHNMFMNQWAETGIIGLLTLVGFLIALSWALGRYAMAKQNDSLTAWLVLVALASFTAVTATYAPIYWGCTMVLLLLAVSAVTMFRASERIVKS